jgi:hypothetical protein
VVRLPSLLNKVEGSVFRPPVILLDVVLDDEEEDWEEGWSDRMAI